MFKNALDTNKTFFEHKKIQSFKVQKSHFSTGVNTEPITPLEKSVIWRLCKRDIFRVWKAFLSI